MKRSLVYRHVLSIPVLVIILAASAACVVFKQEYPERRSFLIDVERPGGPLVMEPLAGSVSLRPFLISQRYKKGEFVYRLSNYQYESDFYNVFFITPEDMILSQTRDWVSESGIFRNVLDSGSVILPDYVIEANIVSLHGDYRNPESPLALIELQFLLVNTSKPESEVVLQKNYVARFPIQEREPESLVAGWNEAFSRIMTHFEKDIQMALE